MTRSRAETFAAQWALAHLFQIVATVWWVRNLAPFRAPAVTEIAVAFAAVAVLTRPGSERRLVLLAAIQLIDTWVVLPAIPNHRILSALVNLAIVLVFARNVVLRRRGAPAGPLFEELAPVARWVALVLYAFAALHKLNRDYLDPAYSCATTDVYAGIARWLPAPSHALFGFAAAYGSLLVEATLPILLFVRRTRSIAVLVALVFHFIIVLHLDRHFFDFSSTMFALVLLFTPEELPAVLRDRVAALPTRHALTVLTVALLVLLAAAGLSSHPVALLFWQAGRFFVWFVYGGAVLIAYVSIFLRGMPEPERFAFHVRPRWLWIVPAIGVLNGLNPYVGLKTRSSFDMYSNLRVEGRAPNHLLFGGGLDLFPDQDDVVTVVTSSDPELESYARDRLGIVFFELRARLSMHPTASITYMRHGATVTRARAADDPELVRPIPLLLRKLLWFRPVDLDRHSRCQW